MKSTIFVIALLLFTVSIHAQVGLDWAKRIGGAGNDHAAAIAADSNGNVYIGGGFAGTVDFDPGPGTASHNANGFLDIFLAKYDSTGNFQWVIPIEGSIDNSIESISSIILDDSANVYVTGQARNGDFDPGPGVALLTNPTLASTAFIAKYNTNGSFRWLKTLVQQGSASYGSLGMQLCFDPNGNILITGRSDGSVDFDPGPGSYTFYSNHDIFYAKYNHDGNLLWAKAMGSSNYDFGCGITTDMAGDVYITGSFQGTVNFSPGAGVANLSSTIGTDAFVAKYSGIDGSYLWANKIGGNIDDRGFDIKVNSENNVVVTGDYATTDFDPGPGSANLVSNGEHDIFIAQYDANGNYIWARGIGGIELDQSTALALDDSDNIYITGIFKDTVDFDAGPGTNWLASQGQYAIFLTKYDKLGNHIWALRMGGNTVGETGGRDMCVTPMGYIYTTGVFYNTSTFDPGPPPVNYTSAGMRDIFITKHRDSTICVPHSFTSAYFCPGDTFQFGTQNLTNPGIYNEPFINTYGCNYISTLTLVHYPTSNIHVNANFCYGTTYHWGALVLNSPGIYNQTFQNVVHGCDSNVTLTLTEINLNTNVSQAGIYLTALLSGAAYQWVNCSNGSPVPGANSQSFTATSNGNYAVIVTKGGCRDTSACLTINNVGIENLTDELSVDIYPNPFDEQVYITFGDHFVDGKITLFTINGEMILSKKLFDKYSVIDLTQLSKGIYVMEISSHDLSKRIKLIKN